MILSNQILQTGRIGIRGRPDRAIYDLDQGRCQIGIDRLVKQYGFSQRKFGYLGVLRGGSRISNEQVHLRARIRHIRTGGKCHPRKISNLHFREIQGGHNRTIPIHSINKTIVDTVHIKLVRFWVICQTLQFELVKKWYREYVDLFCVG